MDTEFERYEIWVNVAVASVNSIRQTSGFALLMFLLMLMSRVFSLAYAYACAYALMITSLQSLICFNSKQIKSDHSLESLCSTCICFHNLVAVTFFCTKDLQR